MTPESKKFKLKPRARASKLDPSEPDDIRPIKEPTLNLTSPSAPMGRRQAVFHKFKASSITIPHDFEQPRMASWGDSRESTPPMPPLARVRDLSDESPPEFQEFQELMQDESHRGSFGPLIAEIYQREGESEKRTSVAEERLGSMVGEEVGPDTSISHSYV